MGLTRDSISSERVIVVFSQRDTQRCGVVCCVVHDSLSANRGTEERERRENAAKEREKEREREGGRETRGDVVTLFIHAGNERFIGPD